MNNTDLKEISITPGQLSESLREIIDNANLENKININKLIYLLHSCGSIPTENERIPFSDKILILITILKKIEENAAAYDKLNFETLSLMLDDIADECDNFELHDTDKLDTLKMIEFLKLAEKLCVIIEKPPLLNTFFKLTNIIEKNTQFVLNSQKKINEFIKVNATIIDQLSAVITELSINKNKLLKLSKKTSLDKALTDISGNISNIVNRTNSILSRITFMPLYQVFNRFPSIVSEIAKKMEKKIDFIINDNSVVIDKKIGDTVGEIFIHLIKNSVDHGIELPEIRKENGKPETGKLELNAQQKGNYVIIRIIDDGKGMDKEIIGRKAVEKKVISQEELESMNDEQILGMIFMPGFSTAEKVSDVSGRGVGMDAVKSNIEKIGGSVSLKSEKGVGSEVIIRIPFQMILTQLIFTQITDSPALSGFMLDYIEDIIYFDNPQEKFISKNKQTLFIHKDKEIPVWRPKEFAFKNFSDYNKALIFNNDFQYTVLPVKEILEQTDAIIKSIDFISLKNRLPKYFVGYTIFDDDLVPVLEPEFL